MQFTELNLKEASMEAINFLGFKEPSEIQEKSIPILLEKDIDFIGQAQTGTGKTAAFTLPLLEKLDFSSKHIQAVIIAPTRELANQICEEVKKLSKFDPVRTLAVYGGVPISNQLRDLKKQRPQVIVGTPGRMLDVIGRGAFDLEKCKYVILDEADEMLDMGFFDDVQEILAEVPEKKIWMFSATMPKQILNLINKHFCNPELVKVTKKILTSDSIDQKFCVVNRRDQAESLCRYLDFTQDVYAIVFCKTKIGAKELTDELNVRGFPSDALHGDMSQEQRDITMRKFKQKRINLLVCTDVAARGIDVNDLTHVINYSLPQDNEAYVHRIGRTGRGGSKGIALSIIDPSDMRRISQIERLTKAKIEKITLPEVTEIVNVLTKKAQASFETIVEETDHDTPEFESFKAEFADKSQDDLLKGLYGLIFSQSLKRYKNARSLDYVGREKAERGTNTRGDRARGENGAQVGYERFHITVGKQNGLDVGGFIRLVSKSYDITGGDIGKISLLDSFSFFEVPSALKDKILATNGVSFDGDNVSIQIAKPSASGGSRGGRDSRGGGRRSTGSRDGNSSGRDGASRDSGRSRSRNFNTRGRSTERSASPERNGNSDRATRAPRKPDVDGNSQKAFRR